MNLSLLGFQFRVCMFGILVLVLATLIVTVARAQDATQINPPAATPPAPATGAKAANKNKNKLAYHFEPCIFSTKEFPKGSFLQDEMVQKTLGPLNVQTTFYNEKFEEVKEADTSGRYGAVVRITLGDGTRENRFIPLYRIPDDTQWQIIGQNVKIPMLPGDSPAAVQAREDAITIAMKGAVEGEGLSGDKNRKGYAGLLKGLAKAVPGLNAQTVFLDASARDDAWWFELRKRINLQESYPYLTHLPDGYASDPARRWALILFLHGSGERGDDLSKLNRGSFRQIALDRKLDAIVIAPQCSADERWSMPLLMQLIDDVSAKNRIDPDRIIVTGQSMGGMGTWELADAYPDRFAAIAPVCGGGDPTWAAHLNKLPVWAFHGQNDLTVPVQMSQATVDAIRKVGGTAHLTIFPHTGHDSWTQTYATDALYTWMLAQKRGQPEVKTPGMQEP